MELSIFGGSTFEHQGRRLKLLIVKIIHEKSTGWDYIGNHSKMDGHFFEHQLKQRTCVQVPRYGELYIK